MANVVMALGTHIFYVPQPNNETPSFDGVETDSTFTWLAQNRLSRDPAMQFSGPGEEHISITGRLFPNHFGGLATLDAMRDSGRAGKVLQLVRFHPLSDPTGMAGQVVGTFGITRLRKIENKVGSNGIAHKIDFTVELVAYGDDKKSGTTYINPLEGEPT